LAPFQFISEFELNWTGHRNWIGI